MAEPKDRFGLDIPAPTPPSEKSGGDGGRINTKVPRGYRATQKPGLFRKVRGMGRKKKEKAAKFGAPSLYSKIYEAHREKLAGIVTKFLTEELGVVVEWLKDMTNVRRKIRKTMHYHAFLTAGLAILLYGIARYIECLCPQLACGMAFMIIGLLAAIIAIVYRRYS